MQVLGVSFRGSLAVMLTMMMIHGTGCYIDEAVILISFSILRRDSPVRCTWLDNPAKDGYDMHTLSTMHFFCIVAFALP